MGAGQRGTLRDVSLDAPAVPSSRQQTLSLGLTTLALLPDSDAVLPLLYRVEGDPQGTTGLGFLLHFDSRQLSWQPARQLFEPGWWGPGPVLSPTAERPEESDGDPDTDQVIRFSYLDPGGRWPGTASPVQLAELSFHSRSAFQHTNLRLTALTHAPGTTFQAAPLLLRCPPQIRAISVTPTSARPWWQPGDGLTITVAFSEAVQVSGEPTVALRLGGQARQATYQGGSGTRELQFRYAISPGDRDSLVIGADALQLPPSSSIQALDGLAASLRHGAPELPAGRVDSAPPTVRVDPINAMSRASSLSISGLVSDGGGSGVAAVQLWDGNRSLGEARLSGSRWSFSTQLLEEGVHSFTAVAIDRAGNRSPAPSAQMVTIDRTPPAPPRLLSTLGGSDQVLTGAAGDAELLAQVEPGATVKLTIGSLIADLQADDQGIVSWAPSAGQIESLERSRAPQTVSLVATDRAGNSSATTRTPLRLPQAVGSYGSRQVRLGSRNGDTLLGAACSIAGHLRGEAVFAGSGNDSLTGVAMQRPGSGGWALPLLSGGRGDDRYTVAEGSCALIADLGGAGNQGGQDRVVLPGINPDGVDLTLIDQSDLLIARRQPDRLTGLRPIVLLLDPLGRRRPDLGNRIETVQLADVIFNLRSDGALVHGSQVLLPRQETSNGNTGPSPSAALLNPLLDPDLDLRRLTSGLSVGLADQALIG